MKDGIIDIDTRRGNKFGFTSDKFLSYSYLWKDGNRIIISLIGATKLRQGYLSTLVDNIRNKGFKVAIPTPSSMMVNFLKKNHFKETWEETEQGSLEMWIDETCIEI